MKDFITSLSVELLKIRKSKTFLITIIFFAFISAMMGLVMFVQMHPETAGKLGMMGSKASMMQNGEPGWESFSTLMLQAISGIGLIGIAFTSSWVIGQEFTYKTVKDILALPISRTTIIISKFIVIVLWSVALFTVYLLVGLAISWLLKITPESFDIFLSFFVKYWVTALLCILLMSPMTFLTSYSKGIILPLGIAILTVILANFSGMVGLGPYFPWSIPGVYAVSGSVPEINIVTSSYVILIVTSLIGFVATLRWWNYADHA